jgi:hypothetical protein
VPGAGSDPLGDAFDYSKISGTDEAMRHKMDTRSQPRQARLRLPDYHCSPTAPPPLPHRLSRLRSSTRAGRIRHRDAGPESILWACVSP